MIVLPGSPIVAHRDGRTSRAISTDGRTVLVVSGAVWRVADLIPAHRTVLETIA